MSDSRVTPAWNFKGMLMENNSRVITNADATLDQTIYEHGDFKPEDSYVEVVKDDDMAHFYFHICSEKGEPAYIKVTKNEDGNIVITGSDHSGTTSETLIVSTFDVKENDDGVEITLTTIENGEQTVKTAQIYDSTISVEETDYGALITMKNSKGTESTSKLYNPTISAKRREDNTGVDITITSGKEGAEPTTVSLYDPTISGKRVTGGAEITIDNHTGGDPTVISLYDAGSDSLAEEFDEEVSYNIGDYVSHESIVYRCVKNISAGEWDVDNWIEVKLANEINDSFKIIADEYDETKAYKEDDFVIYNNKLYKSKQDSEAEEFNQDNWTQTKVTDELSNKHYMVTMFEYNSLTPVNNGIYFITTPDILSKVTIFECGDTAASATYEMISGFTSYSGTDFAITNQTGRMPTCGYGLYLWKSYSGYGSMIKTTPNISLKDYSKVKVKFYLCSDGQGKNTLYATTKTPSPTFNTSEWTELKSNYATSASAADIIEVEFNINSPTQDNGIYFCVAHTEVNIYTAMCIIKSIEIY